MSLVVVGCSHRTVPLDLVERVTVADEDLEKRIRALAGSPEVFEVVVVSTCMRTEVYAVVDRFHAGVEHIESWFADLAGARAAELDDALGIAYDDAAAAHLFEVASGIDSNVLGEGEVLSQVRRAAERARAAGCSGPVLDRLFQHAVRAGKRARTETRIASGTLSSAHAAVALARKVLGSYAGRSVLVVGAGEMATGICRALGKENGVGALTVASRTPARARALAGVLQAGVATLAELPRAIERSDVVFSALSTTAPVVAAADVLEALDRRLARSATSAEGGAEALTGTGDVVIVDVAVPRNIDPNVREVPGVVLLDADDLQRFTDEERLGRESEVARVRALIGEELERHRADEVARGAAPIVTALRRRAEAIRREEVEAWRPAETGGDDARDRYDAIDRATGAVLRKLLHEPTVRLKESAGTPRGERLAEALRVLFGL